MNRQKKTIEAFSMSFLDVICCALGGTLVLLLSIDPEEPSPTKLEDIEVAFVMDATGSMGDVLVDIKSNIESAISVLSKLSPDLRVGFVVYRDIDDGDLISERFPITGMDGKGIAQLQLFLNGIEAKGGEPKYEEAVEKGLSVASKLNWSKNAKNYIVVIGDAPCHPENEELTLKLASEFAARNDHSMVSSILTFELDASQKSNPELARAFDRFEKFFQELAKAGDGEYAANRGKILESILLATLRRDD